MQQKARCVSCRTDVNVPDSFADGDHIKCSTCDTGHRVVRGNGPLRLVIADVGPLRDALRANDQRLMAAERELADARASWGIGINGFLIGLLYVVVQIVLENQPLTQHVVVTAIALSLIVGVLLELANLLFLQKRTAILRLSNEIAELKTARRDLQRTIRDATIRQ